MAKKRKTVEELAKEAHLDTDEALIALWDAGYDNILNPKDRPRESNRARRALGLATRRELKSVAYWMSVFDLYEPEFRSLLCDLSVPIAEQTHKLPTKTISRLRGEARKRKIDPITGKAKSLDIRLKASGTIVPSWKKIGHERSLRWLTEDEVERIHFELVKDFSTGRDPIEPAGIRTESLLASAVFRPKTSLGGVLKYPSVEMSAAALLHSIIHDHPFHNGNKRTALVSALVFLDENGFFPKFNQDEAFKLVLDVAQHRITDYYQENIADRETLEIAYWFCDNCRVLEKGDHPISFRKLRQILLDYDCELIDTTGSKINITRIKKKSSFFSKRKNLHTQ
ncbi:MAG: type II toxin-antitoxin system death-on-curing family toxin, partial [Sedimentisphaerales bacterium]